jgi:hypothetical protein
MLIKANALAIPFGDQSKEWFEELLTRMGFYDSGV